MSCFRCSCAFYGISADHFCPEEIRKDFHATPRVSLRGLVGRTPPSLPCIFFIVAVVCDFELGPLAPPVTSSVRFLELPVFFPRPDLLASETTLRNGAGPLRLVLLQVVAIPRKEVLPLLLSFSSSVRTNDLGTPCYCFCECSRWMTRRWSLILGSFWGFPPPYHTNPPGRTACCDVLARSSFFVH